ncbi:uncharacterized protein MELLADRAFT_102733 [Melampsora larici-populina 98AG31]|uniref:CxC1-like cysteine cluster associated with KDZ transposases domain-containing protein n=1 Tax=Melampsora larici-populina (strain 98AG31 / pathotype 3-4-7) TaxID=747676 RepID=F4R975_MELLP|nr:uncharacterized protein MELLADRAFT_102733 [Melampsora larici-populina 98AG31]EGG10933.1 hypothetical protein MELLADRAFT_102733 [Melampsora larici-populina 98AG31]
MVLPGEEVGPEPKRKRRENVTSNSSIGARLANMEALEEADAKNLEAQRARQNAPVPVLPPINQADSDEEPAQLYDAFMPADVLQDLAQDANADHQDVLRLHLKLAGALRMWLGFYMPRLPRDQKFFPSIKPKRHRDTEPDRHHIPHDRAVNLLQNLGIGPARPVEPPAELDRHDEHEDDWNNQPDVNYDPQDDPPVPTLDGAAERLAEAARAQHYAQKRLNFEKQWVALAAPVTAVYLERQHATQNWTTSMSYLANQPECRCNNQTTRLIDLIDMYGRLSSYQFTFCKCCPDVIRLLYAGYFASSPSQPHTAFSIPLIQFHNRLWQTSALSTSSFIDALGGFLDDRSASPLYGQLRNGTICKRELRKPITHSIDLYRRILYHQELLYIEGLELSLLEVYADKCSRCFGPREGEITKVADLCKNTAALASDIKSISMCRLHYPVSILGYFLEQLPNIKFGVLYDIGCHLDAHIKKFYSADFLREQWILERNAQASKKHAEEQQKLELGRLLCLEQEIQKLWNSPVPTAEYEISRAQRLNELQEKITTQRRKVGAADVLALLTRPEHDGLLMVWYCMRDVRSRLIAIFKEKLPLNQSQAHGRDSNLGTVLTRNTGVSGRTAVLASIRKHAAALGKAVDRYQERLNTFRQKFPNRLAYPPDIEYATLFQIAPDDPFWSEGLFTNHNEPWAIDPSTQYGMRQLSYLERSEEELRRIGWEVRREMRWIINTRTRISHLLQCLLHVALTWLLGSCSRRRCYNESCLIF